jgi:hypothetical protein
MCIVGIHRNTNTTASVHSPQTWGHFFRCALKAFTEIQILQHPYTVLRQMQTIIIHSLVITQRGPEARTLHKQGASMPDPFIQTCTATHPATDSYTSTHTHTFKHTIYTHSHTHTCKSCAFCVPWCISRPLLRPLFTISLSSQSEKAGE